MRCDETGLRSENVRSKYSSVSCVRPSFEMSNRRAYVLRFRPLRRRYEENLFSSKAIFIFVFIGVDEKHCLEELNFNPTYGWS